MEKNQVKFGALLSYLLIVINSFYGLVIAPFVLGTIGDSEYGVYKTIASMTASVAVLEFGLSGTLQRYLAKYRALKDEKSGYNFSAMCMIQALILILLMGVVGVVLYFMLESMYGESFSAEELHRAKQIFVVLILYVMLHLFENVFFGIITGYNQFIFSNSLKVFALLTKIGLYFIVLPIVRNSLAIVSISLLIEIITIVVEYLYVKMRLRHRIVLYKWDGAVFKESFVYTGLLFIQSIIIQFNGNIDNMVIGAVIGTTAVTVYSFSIQMFNMYETCATSVSSVVLPSVTKKIYEGATPRELEEYIVKFGRVQWAVLGAALGGFVCFGREFFALWLGDGFEDCYPLSLILIVPITFPLIVNVCLAILKAKNLLVFRTIALAYSALLNALLTFIGTRIWGYWAAATGTAVATIIGSIISLNVYYQIKLKINVFKLYLKILRGTTLCIAVACAAGLFLNDLIAPTGWFYFAVKAAAFIVVYAAGMFLFGLNKDEKASLMRKKQQ